MLKFVYLFIFIENLLFSQSNLEKENQTWRHHTPGLQDVLQSWHKNRHSDQWNRTENPEVDPKMYSQLIFDKARKNIQWKKDSVFSNGVEEIGQ